MEIGLYMERRLYMEIGLYMERGLYMEIGLNMERGLYMERGLHMERRLYSEHVDDDTVFLSTQRVASPRPQFATAAASLRVLTDSLVWLQANS